MPYIQVTKHNGIAMRWLIIFGQSLLMVLSSHIWLENKELQKFFHFTFFNKCNFLLGQVVLLFIINYTLASSGRNLGNFITETIYLIGISFIMVFWECTHFFVIMKEIPNPEPPTWTSWLGSFFATQQKPIILTKTNYLFFAGILIGIFLVLCATIRLCITKKHS